MKKLLFLLVFIPLVSFGQFENDESVQNEIDYNSERSVINYFEKKVLVDQDPMLGIWESSLDFEFPFSSLKRLAITKNKGKYYFVIIGLGQNALYKGVIPIGDTLAIAEFSHSRNKLFIKAKVFGEYTQKARKRININSISGYENVTIIGEKERKGDHITYFEYNEMREKTIEVPKFSPTKYDYGNLGREYYSRKVNQKWLLWDGSKKTYSSTIWLYNGDFRKIFPPNVLKNDIVSSNQNQEDVLNLKSESSIKKWLDKNMSDPIEGIWIFSSATSGNYGRSAILKLNDVFKEIHLENLVRNATLNESGEIVASIKKMSGEGVYMFKEKGVTSSAILNGNTMEVFYPGNRALVIREYPEEFKKIEKTTKTGEWAGNGSGIIISKSGYIVTNHHVIEDADEIEVEFILNEEVQKFNAEVVQVDKVNDLAIIKIVDINFDGVDELPYNFKTISSDVGTKIYAFGYPMALSLMGKEIKITDGIISSKSGFDGDITTYQITAPIQGGNSGGPLFDDKGNLLGINSSGIRKDVADNVAYTIKSSYILNLIDVMPTNIELPSNTKLQSLSLTEQIKEISKYVVLIKVK